MIERGDDGGGAQRTDVLGRDSSLQLSPHDFIRGQIGTRPDISFAVSTLSQYLDAPHTTHVQAAIGVFRYLSGTKDLKLVLGGSTTNIVGYSDAD